MCSNEEKELIIEYWYRTSTKSSFSIVDITQIMIAFAQEYDKFDPSISSSFITILDDYTTLTNDNDDGIPVSAFGIVDVVSGRKYQWTIKIMEPTDSEIGIIEKDKCEENRDDYWWCESFGFSYFDEG